MPRTATFAFDETVTIVTGATGSLGTAVADRFVRAGSTVCGVDVAEPDPADSATDDAPFAAAERAHFSQADLTDESDVERVIAEISDEYGRIDHVLNIAGTWRGGQPIEATSVDEFDLLMDVNLKTAFLTSKHALPALQEAEGAIVNVSSRSSLEGGAGDGPYRISKAGIRLLTETLAAENRGTVRANCVMPSVIDTPMNREMMPDADHNSWVDPGEIADIVAFLCSDAASVTSGAAVPVYGEA
ncbi:short-chain dehydrogenase/reductase SDR [Halovivax asiaticus JCM 14624]|uniref:Short-chain dehydrogenase/reductase SDR n=1 Tax=Halovivax asiaticus JCM 14624 TaxID=1227490 RepID=M0B891_9EURY|nr:SDR family oxidoreductase [Halovivax asiaticus]ELZ07136.1 short-chain dehydrogenase/reductase SDR [Halovivax asiaticus JCM 14624]